MAMMKKSRIKTGERQPDWDSGDRHSVPQGVEEIAADHHRLVGGRIENGPEPRSLIEAPRDDAVQEIGDGRSGEDKERDPVLSSERCVDEDGNGKRRRRVSAFGIVNINVRRLREREFVRQR